MLQCSAQLSDDDAAGSVICRGLDVRVDVENQLRHVVVPIQIDDQFRSQPAPAADVDRRRGRGRELEDVVEHGIEDLRSGDDPFRDALDQTVLRRLLAVS